MMDSMKKEPTFYPLGRNIFASVKTWRGKVKIHVRHYADTKEGAVVPTQRGVIMDLQQFQTLLKAQKNICMAYHQQLDSANGVAMDHVHPLILKKKKKTKKEEYEEMSDQTRLSLPSDNPTGTVMTGEGEAGAPNGFHTDLQQWSVDQPKLQQDCSNKKRKRRHRAGLLR
jgi:hypothetical protein